MNKQELIEKIKANGEWLETNRYVKITKAVELISQLDEPQKIKVPEFVAKWFETNKYVLDRAILDYMFEDYASDDSEFGKWFDNKNGKPIETLVRMLDGYEVEEEPKWVVLGERGYLTSLSIGKGKSTGWTGNNDKHESGAIHFEDEETALHTAYITGGTVEKV
ncbi:MAG: DUF1642 domain-containing protein [Enterococcus devriesei]|uniref:DUF1642 domain-containing protein n=1 Tax=Enterococcus devriesei TaxID=319970 RepID=UPI003F9071BA